MSYDKHAKGQGQRSAGLKIDWKQTGGWTDMTDRITFPANAVD